MSLSVEGLEGKYEILDKLGEGGMGAVYKVRHRLLEEIRVVKVMRAALTGDAELEARFLREARVATRLRHPNIAQVYDFTIDGAGNAYIVLEFIEGLTLQEVLKEQGLLPVPMVLEISRQSLKAIGYLHRKSFVHRDISPDNLMLSRDMDGQPLVKLIDLGIAKVLEGEGAGMTGLTATGMFLGKVRYTSPEQLEASSEKLDGRSDLYSFGVVLYEMLTGHSPIQGTTPTAMMAGHLFHPPVGFDVTDPAHRVPDALREVVFQALAKKREERIQSAQVFSRRLGKLQNELELVEEEMRETLDRILTAEVQREAGKESGSTQERLDEQFRPVPTPERGKQAAATEQITELYRQDPTVSMEEATPARTQPSVSRVVERIGAEIAAGRLQSAEYMLQEALTAHGELRELLTLRGQLDQRREETRQERLSELLGRASQLGEAEDFEAGLNELEEVLRIDPESSTARSLIAAFREGLEKQQTERERQQAADKVEELLAAGQLEEAERQLAEAAERCGPGGILSELSQRLEEMQRLLEVDRLKAEAEGSAQREEYGAAVAALEKAQELMPDHTQVQKLLEKHRGALERQEAERRRLAAVTEILARLARGELEAAGDLLAETIAKHGETEDLRSLSRRLSELRERTAAVAEIEELLAAERWDEAKERIAEAERKLPEETVFQELTERLDELKRLSLEREAAALVEKARAQLDNREYESALATLRQAAELVPGHAEHELLAVEIREAREREEAERRRTRAIEQAVSELTRLLDAGELDRARERLDEAARELGEAPAFAAFRQQLKELQKQERARRKLDSLLEEARKLQEARHFEKALKKVEEARQIDAEDDRLQSIQAAITEARRQEAAEEHAREVRKAAAKIEKQILAGKLDAAAQQLEAALGKLGDEAELAELSARIEKERQSAAARKAAAEKTTVLQELPGAGDVTAVLPAAAEKTMLLETPAAPPAPPPSKPPSPAAASSRTLVKPRAEAPPVEARSPVRSKRGIAKVAVPAAAALVLVLLAALVFSRRDSSPPPVAAATGTLVVNAIPWGEVTGIVDEEGQPHPLPDQVYTPVVLTLPPGDYVVALRNEGHPEPVSLEVRIVAGETARELKQLSEVSVDELFKSLGW